MSLNGLNVMVTRPAHQAESLCQAIVKQGGLVTRFPTIEIKPTLSPSNLSTFLKRAKRADILIFISQNAVRCVAPFWQETQAKLLAVGPSTRAMIKNYSMGLTGPVPEEKISSEGLL